MKQELSTEKCGEQDIMALVICEKQEDGSYAPIDHPEREAAGKRIAELEAELSFQTQRAIELSEKLDVAKASVANSDKALVEITEELLTRRTRIRELEKSQADALQHLKDERAKREETHQRIDDVKYHLGKANEDLTKRNSELEALRDKLHTEKAEAQKESHDMSKTVLRLEEWVAKLEEQKATLRKCVDALGTPVSRDDCDQMDLTICEKGLDGHYRPIYANQFVNRMRRELDLKQHFEGQVEDRNKSIAELKKQVEQSELDRVRAESHLQETASQLTEAKERIAQMEVEDDRPLPAISEVDTLKDEVQHLKDQIAEMEAEHEECRNVAATDYRQMEAKFKEVSVLLGNAEQAREVARKNYTDVRECWQAAEQECKELQGDYDELREDYGELRKKFEKLCKSLSPLYEVGAACILRDAGINNEGRYVNESCTTLGEVQDLHVKVLLFDATNFGEEYLVEAEVDGHKWRVSVPEERLATNTLEDAK